MFITFWNFSKGYLIKFPLPIKFFKFMYHSYHEINTEYKQKTNKQTKQNKTKNKTYHDKSDSWNTFFKSDSRYLSL